MRWPAKTVNALALYLAVALFWPFVLAAQPITYSGGIYSENFDSIGPVGTNTPAGWFYGTGNNGNGAISGTGPLIVTDGSANLPGHCNVGITADTDRALGSHAAGSAGGDLNMEVRIRNQTGQAIDAFEVRYDGEQWRANQATKHPQRLEMRYSTNGISFVSMGSNFWFTETQPNGTNALDGNLASNRVAHIGGIYRPAAPVTNGATMYLRWFDANDSGWDQLLAIDNFSFAANVTPPDTNPPALLKAFRLRDLTNILVTFSEAISTNSTVAHGSVLDPRNYCVFQTLDQMKILTVYGYAGAYGSSSLSSNGEMVVQLRIESPLEKGYDANASYTLMVSNVADVAGNEIAEPSFTLLTPQYSFQHGINGYYFCQDTSLTPGSNAGWTVLGTNNDSVWADLTDGLPPDDTQGLLRFDQLFGSGARQIPPGAKITSALLTLFSTRAAEDSGSRVLMFLMLTNWSQETAAYYLFGTNGVHTNGVQAATTPVATFLPNFPNPNWINTQSRTVEVASSLQGWANGQANYGWFFLGTSGDGYGFDSIKFTNVHNHPLLLVDFESALEMGLLLPTNHLYVNEGEAFQIAFSVSPGSGQLQWYKDGTAIPGAGSSALWFGAASLTEGGEYFLQASNQASSIISTTVQVTVIRQLQLTLAASATNQATLSWTAPEVVLQEAASIDGPWQDLSPPATSPCVLPMSPTNQFYRLRPR